MKKIKGLLYCCKAKPSLMKYENIDGYYTDTDPVLDKRALLNGKIVAECDFEVEEIEKGYGTHHASFDENGYFDDYYDYMTKTIDEDILLKRSCLNIEELETYNPNYAIHIKNLHIFDEPRELSDFTTRTPVYYDSIICDSCTNFGFDCNKCRYSCDYQQVIKAPKNMMKVCEWDIEDKVLISIKSERLCKILNGEKTIVVRRKVLKEMLENEI